MDYDGGGGKDGGGNVSVDTREVVVMIILCGTSGRRMYIQSFGVGSLGGPTMVVAARATKDWVARATATTAAGW